MNDKGKLIKNVNLREYPSTDADILTLMPKNTVIKIDSFGKDWSKVKFNKFHTGYVYSEYIKIEKQENKKLMDSINGLVFTPLVIFMALQLFHNWQNTQTDRRYKSGKRLLNIDKRRGIFQRIIISLTIGIPLGIIVALFIYFVI